MCDASFLICVLSNANFTVPISQLIKKIFARNFEGGLIDYQLCFTQNLKFLAVREPVFLKSKILPKSAVNPILNVL